MIRKSVEFEPGVSIHILVDKDKKLVQFYYTIDDEKDDGPFESEIEYENNEAIFYDEEGDKWYLGKDFGIRSLDKKVTEKKENNTRIIQNKTVKAKLTKKMEENKNERKITLEEATMRALQGKLVEDNHDKIIWDDIEEYPDDLKEEIYEILDKEDPKAIKYSKGEDYYSVLIEIYKGGLQFWMDFSQEDDDIVGEWNQYIFFDTDKEDLIRSALQSAYTQDWSLFGDFDDIGYYFLEDKGIIVETEDGYTFKDNTNVNENKKIKSKETQLLDNDIKILKLNFNENDEDIEQIERALNVTTFTLINNKTKDEQQISTDKARKLLGDEAFICALDHSAFHRTSTQETKDKRYLIYFDSSKLFD